MYVGTSRATGETLRIGTETRKNVPEYFVTVEVTPKNGKKVELKFARSFTEWFDVTGRFVVAPFQTMLVSSVPVIAKADPKRAAAALEGAGAGTQASGEGAAAYSPEILEMLANADVSVVGSAAEEATGSEAAAGKKGGKRRKA